MFFYTFLRFKTLCTQFFGFRTQTKNAYCSSNKQQFSIFQLFASHLRHGIYDMGRISKYQYRKRTHTTRKSSKLTFQYLLTRKKLKISRAYHKILTVEFLHKQINFHYPQEKRQSPSSAQNLGVQLFLLQYCLCCNSTSI